MSDEKQTCKVPEWVECKNQLAGIENGVKEALDILHGETDRPGVLHTLRNHDKVLFGTHESQGLIDKVRVMYRAHVFILCAFSGIGGWLLRELAVKLHW